MIHQFKVRFDADEPKLPDRPDGYPLSEYGRLSDLIAALNECPRSYCVVLQVTNDSTFDNHRQLTQKIDSLVSMLSKRELEVFKLAIRGLRLKEISETLCISIDTVKTHRKKIVSKAGVRNIEEIKDWLLLTNSW